MINALNGIGVEYRELVAGILVREFKISFEELLDKFRDYENFLKKQDLMVEVAIPSANFAAKGKQSYNKSSSYDNKGGPNQTFQTKHKIVCQFCNKPERLAKTCWKIKNNK